MIKTVQELLRQNNNQLEIILSVREEELASATVAVAWCLPKTTALVIARQKLEWVGLSHRDRLLISVQSGQTETSRQLVPLDDGLAYVQFHRPGLNIVHATIVSNCSPDRENKLLTRCSARSYRQGVYDHAGEFQPDFAHGFGVGSVSVEVPEDLFAKKPPGPIWNWVNWWHETLPVDQCQFRRRAIVAFTVKPFFALLVGFLWALAYLANILLVLLLGLRWSRIDWLCENGWPVQDVDWTRDSFFCYKRRKGWDPPGQRHLAWWFLAPVIPAGFFVVGFLIWLLRGLVERENERWFIETFFAPRQLWWVSLVAAVALSLLAILVHGAPVAFCRLSNLATRLVSLARAHRKKSGALGVLALLIFALALLRAAPSGILVIFSLWLALVPAGVLLSVFLGKIWRWTLGKKLSAMMEARMMARQARRDAEDRRRLLFREALDANAPIALLPVAEILPPEVSALVCVGGQRPLSVEELPPSRRTFRLRFQALKSRVCRPFSW